MSWSVKVEGTEPIVRALKEFPASLDSILRPALKAGGVVIVGAQRAKVHKVTRKLAQGIGMTEQGQGAAVEVHVGIQPGLGTPRAYSKSSTASWAKPRDGINRGDPQVYAKYEEARHPFFLNTFAQKRAEVERAILARASAEMQRRLKT